MDIVRELFLDEIEVKNYALKYFPEFFAKDYAVKKNINFQEVRDKYLKYCEKYFITNPENNAKLHIYQAFNYLRIMCEKEFLRNPFANELLKELLEKYNSLIDELTNYEYYPVTKKSSKARENETNKNILFELSFFKDLLFKALENLDMYFRNEYNINIREEEVNKVLEELIVSLEAATQNLASKRAYYHSLKNSNINFGVINETQKQWHQARNHACYIILSTHHNLLEINQSIILPVLWMQETLTKTYQEYFKYLKSSPNFYSYLSPQDRETLTKENKLRKRCLSEQK